VNPVVGAWLGGKQRKDGSSMIAFNFAAKPRLASAMATFRTSGPGSPRP
jgi:hypothetical protein